MMMWWYFSERNRGENSRTSVLKESQVYEIRRRWDAGERNFHEEFNVGRSTVYSIGVRRTWKHLEEEK